MREELLLKIANNHHLQLKFDRWIDRLYPEEKDTLMFTKVEDLYRWEFNKFEVFGLILICWPFLDSISVEESKAEELFERALRK